MPAKRIVLRSDHLSCSVRREKESSIRLVFPGLVGGVALLKRSINPETGHLWYVAYHMSYKDRCVLVNKNIRDKDAVLMAENRWRAFSNLCEKLDGPVCAWFFDNANDARYIKAALGPRVCYPVAQRNTYLHVEVGDNPEDKAEISQYNGPELAARSL